MLDCFEYYRLYDKVCASIVLLMQTNVIINNNYSFKDSLLHVHSLSKCLFDQNFGTYWRCQIYHNNNAEMLHWETY